MFEYTQEPHCAAVPFWIRISWWQPRGLRPRRSLLFAWILSPVFILANYLLSIYSFSPSEIPTRILILNFSLFLQRCIPPKCFMVTSLAESFSSLICSSAVFILLSNLPTDNIFSTFYNILFMSQISKTWFFKTSLFIYFIYLYFWLHWVFIATHRLSPAVVQGLRHGGFSCCGAQSTVGSSGSVATAQRLYGTGSEAVVHRFSCPVARGIFSYQASNLCPLHCKADC